MYIEIDAFHHFDASYRFVSLPTTKNPSKLKLN